MAQVSREKIALVVFVACILLIGCGIAAYLVAGHSWNYAATSIDDVAGEMEGYDVILYEGTAIPASSRIDGHGSLAAAPKSLRSAVADYQEKGARVYALDLVHPERYDTPVIIGKDGYRIGVANIPAGDTNVSAQEKVDFLRAHQVDIVLAIVPVQASISKVEGIDVFIDLGERSPLTTGQSSADGFRVTMPDVGTVGAIVISPNEVVSARTITG